MAAVKKFRKACASGVASCTTAWDYPTAMLAEEAGIDLILIGDSTGIVALGQENTQGVTVDEIIYHCKAVARGANSPFLLGDMPFGSYEQSPEQAVHSAIRIVKEGKVDGVKLEGGAEMAPQVAAIIKAGIPVIGHIGLTPQRALNASLDDSAEAFGSTAESARDVLQDALALQKAGAIAVLLEAVAGPAAAMITSKLSIPTIGIGCGPTTSAQIALQSELLGYQRSLIPKWHKKYVDVGAQSVAALKQFKQEVQGRQFPTLDHGYDMAKNEQQKMEELCDRVD